MRTNPEHPYLIFPSPSLLITHLSSSFSSLLLFTVFRVQSNFDLKSDRFWSFNIRMGSNELFMGGARSAYLNPSTNPNKATPKEDDQERSAFLGEETKKEVKKPAVSREPERGKEEETKRDPKEPKEAKEAKEVKEPKETKEPEKPKKLNLSRERLPETQPMTDTEKEAASSAAKKGGVPKKRKKRRIRIASLDQSASIAEEKTTHEKEDFGSLEKKLREFDFYHGFLPREDLQSTLQNPGDYLLRVSEVHENETKVNREVILSLIPVHTDNKDEDEKKKCRNVVIKRVAGPLYFCETTRTFDSITELISYYTKNTGTFSAGTYQLKNPILIQQWEFMHSDVTIGKVLGEGAFGKVCAGTLKMKDGSSVEVACKMTKASGFLCKLKIKEMMNEARFIRNFNHKNVVRLYGVAHDEQPLYILLELVKGGSLQEYLKQTKNVPLIDRIKFCLGAAKGIEYLHQNNCIHRDIAARNCLLSEKEVKITDFGLSRTGPSYRMKNSCKLPVKWLAPETISTLTFSFATDVYSWGITCYEVFADGAEPFEGITNAQVKQDLTGAKYLQMPKDTPDAIKKYISGLVFVDPSRRASMADAVTEFERFALLCEDKALEAHGAKMKILKVFKKKG